MWNRRSCRPFILVELLLAMSLMVVATSALISFYAHLARGLVSIRCQLQARRDAQLYSYRLHTQEELSKVLPNWYATDPDRLHKNVYRFDSLEIPLELRLELLKPSEDLKGHSRAPTWRRLLAFRWFYEGKLVWVQPVIVASKNQVAIPTEGKR